MKKTNLLLCTLFLVFILTSCSPRITTTVFKQYPPVDKTAPVRVFEYGEQAPESSEVLGMVAITDKGFTTKCDYESVKGFAIEETRRMGGNAFQVTDHRLPNFWGSTCHEIAGTALRILLEDSTLNQKPTFKIEDGYRQAYGVRRRLYQTSPFDFTVNVGYGVIYNRTKGLDRSEKRAERELSNGLTWDATFHQYFKNNMGWGIQYSGYNSSTIFSGFDHNVLLTYIAPQYSLKAVWEKLEMKYELGVGYMRYYNKVTAPQGVGAVYGNTIAANMTLGFEYKLSKHFGLGVDLGLVGGSFGKLKYKNLIPERELGEDERMGVERINFTLGFRYYIGKKK